MVLHTRAPYDRVVGTLDKFVVYNKVSQYLMRTEQGCIVPTTDKEYINWHPPRVPWARLVE